MIELLDALADARDVWRRVERAAAELADQELNERVAIARLAILDSADQARELVLVGGPVA